ncbi:MAG: DUF1799 domain-containing protein [Bauldia sp.]
MIDDAARFGFSEKGIGALRSHMEAAPGTFMLWPEHEAAVRAFMAVCGSQWRAAISPTGRIVYLGLDYAGARAGLDAAGIDVTPELWADLQTMEHAAAAALNEVVT